MLSGLSWHQSALSVEFSLWVDIPIKTIIKLDTGYQKYLPVMLSCMMGQYLPSLQQESIWVALAALLPPTITLSLSLSLSLSPLSIMNDSDPSSFVD